MKAIKNFVLVFLMTILIQQLVFSMNDCGGVTESVKKNFDDIAY